METVPTFAFVDIKITAAKYMKQAVGTVAKLDILLTGRSMSSE